ncbi:MAG: nucleoside deaminase [Planctomycetota bacterium]
MALALEEARRAAAEDEVPVGAVIVSPPGEGGDRRVLARAHNRTRTLGDPTAHAEILAVREAARVLGYQRLDGCTIYCTVEPCFMCAGALVHARVERAVWSVRDPKFGAGGSLGNALSHPAANHRVATTEGVRSAEARSLLQEFFRQKR